METAQAPSAPGPESQAGTPVSRLSDKLVEVRKRGVKPGSSRGPYKKTPAGPSSVSDQGAAPAMPVVFNEANFTRLVSIPFDFMAFRTGMGGWQLTPDEKKELAITGVPCCNEWVGVNPKWISLTVFSLSLVGIATAKIMGYAAALRELELQKLVAKSAKNHAEPRTDELAVPVKANPGPELPDLLRPAKPVQ